MDAQVRTLAHYVGDADNYALALVDDDGVFHAVAAYANHTIEHPGLIYLQLIAVSLPSQGGQLGQALLADMTRRWSETHDATRVVWLCHEDNERFQHIGRKFGAAPASEEEIAEMGGIDTGYVLLVLNLT